MRTNVRQLSLAAVMLASVFVVTRFIQIPIPLGYFTPANSVILLFCLAVPNAYGIAASGIGSALADLLSYPVYTIPTLVIKILMPYVFLLLYHNSVKIQGSAVWSAAIATLIPLFAYTITGCLIYGSVAAGITQFPGLLAEYVANLALVAVLYRPVVHSIATVRH